MSTPAATLAAPAERPAESLRALSRRIHAGPELAFNEHRNAKVADPGMARCFEVECGMSDLDTGFSVGAALALREVAEPLEATIKSMGTPAEEFGGSRVLPLKLGVFDEMVMMVHPAPEETCARRLLGTESRRAPAAGGVV